MTEAVKKEIQKSLKVAEDALAGLLKDLRDAEAAGLDVKQVRADYDTASESLRKMKRVYG